MSVDVIVAGGGTAGFGAALSAARAGLRVTLVEASAKIGGVMAFCPGMPWGAAYPCDVMIGGIMEELADRLMTMNPPAAEKRPCTLANFGPEIQYDHDIATLTMFEMLEEAGVELRLNTLLQEPVMDGARVKAVKLSDRHGTSEIPTKIAIDCSGDGDLSAKAGVPYTLGDEHGNMMGVTLSFHMLDVDWARAFADPDPYFQKFAAVGISEGRLHPDLAQLYLMRGFHANTVFCNSVSIRGVDGTDANAVTRATQEGRRRALQLAQFLVRDVPGFESARMAMMGPTIGVRETRKLKGLLQIKGADLARGMKYPDGIVACDNPIDDVMRESSAMTHEAIVEAGDFYTIPFRALLPEKIENLMFAGRIVSADAMAFASVRGMPQCMAMGQAAGVAAALAIRDGVPVQAVDHAELVRVLQGQGVRGIGGASLSE